MSKQQVSVFMGGTGANTASAALTNLGAAPAAAYAQANAAYGQANSAFGQANLAYAQANSAFTAANNAVLKAGDTMTGNLAMTGTQPAIRLEESGSGGSKRLQLSVNSSGVATISADQSAQEIAFTTVGSERLRITSDGNVGIGTTIPNISSGASGSAALTLSAFSSGRNALIELKGTRTTANQISSYIRSFSNSATTPGVDLVFYRGVADTDGILAISTSGTERLRIAANGNVGIGTTNPTIYGGGLEVARANQVGIRVNCTNGLAVEIGSDTTAPYIQTITDGARLDFYTGAAATRIMTLNGANVGVGITNPSYKLHVYDSIINATAKLQNANTNGYAELIFESATKVSSIFQSSGGFTSYGGANSFNIYAASGSKIAFHPGGASNQVTFDTNGRVGIGITSPENRLEVVASTTSSYSPTGYSGAYLPLCVRANSTTTGDIAGIRFINSNASIEGVIGYVQTGSGTADFVIQGYGNASSYTEKMRITGTGNVGIGTTNPTEGVGGSNGFSFIRTGAGGGSVLQFNGENGRIRPVSGASRLEIDGGNLFLNQNYNTNVIMVGGGGNVGIGSASPGAKLEVAGTVRAGSNWSQGDLQLTGLLSGYAADTYPTLKTSGSCLHFDAQGTYTGYICYNGGFTDVSDARLKTNVTPLLNALNTVTNLQGVRYAWKDGRDNFQEHVGFIAQQVQEVLPEAVSDPHPHDAEVAMLGIKSPAIVAVLVEAVKEQQAIIESLKSRIEALESAG